MMLFSRTELWFRLLQMDFWKQLYNEIFNDNLTIGAAALAYYFLFALFPAMIFFLTLLPYLPVEHIHEAVMSVIAQALPLEATKAFEKVVSEVTLNKHGGLLSIGALLTLWAASSGLYAMMDGLNITFAVKEKRPYWKVRSAAVLLTICFAVVMIGAFTLIVFGGILQTWLTGHFGWDQGFVITFAVFRWVVITLLLFAGLATTYYFGPDVQQKFVFVTPGAMFAVVIMVLASTVFRIYVESFGDYSASYGSLGAVIILMLWLYILGLVVLIGSEVNALLAALIPLPGGPTPQKNLQGEAFATPVSSKRASI
jgi:membrane protein